MIDLVENTLNGKPIKAWVVRFHTTLGFRDKLEDAIEDAERIMMPPEMIQTIACAITEDGDWEPR